MRWWIAMSMVAGCLKTPPRQVAPSPVPLQVVTLLSEIDSDQVEPLPEAVVTRLSEQLEARNLMPQAQASTSFTERRLWSARVEALQASESPALLVACEARFATQVNGRYRWEVDCQVGLHGEGRFIEGETSSAAHLIYAHQKQGEAVADVAGGLAREVGAVADQWLAARAL